MSEAAASTSTAIPFAPLSEHVAARVRQAGVKQVNLYHALAHASRLRYSGRGFLGAKEGRSYGR